jgi:arylformamidase
VTGPGDPVFDYMTGQTNSSQPSLIATFEREGGRAVKSLEPSLDIPYGPHPRQRFDLFSATAPKATLIYLHAGYWQSRDKAQFRFIAPPFVAQRLNVALVNYPLCPDVGLAELTESVRIATRAVSAATSNRPLIAIGHSAGGHLAVELGLTDWAARHEPVPRITAIIALSGVYDLAPLLATPLNDNLKLNPVTAAAASPISRVRAGAPKALFAVGGLETKAFQDQTHAMARAWALAGNVQDVHVVAGADHFSLLRAFASPEGELFAASAALV